MGILLRSILAVAHRMPATLLIALLTPVLVLVAGAAFGTARAQHALANAFLEQMREDHAGTGTFGGLVCDLLRGLVTFVVIVGAFIWFATALGQAEQLVRATTTAFTTFVRIMSNPAA